MATDRIDQRNDQQLAGLASTSDLLSEVAKLYRRALHREYGAEATSPQLDA
ncbi:hypothetical protein [Blastococcus sp. VKM Ac-2987]|uniref:hypothetical protein n=1 Tax=Blastococcus sp. VKM Ac-2987 TaxID=3004141 RepID=UPI0022AB78DD|nr:hypothetical protein [Blastococcus sp. VKM Ac-2987]MCZ2857439.1 hypothetical protein [Blastococcus sp. VKM Ac-2987]